MFTGIIHSTAVVEEFQGNDTFRRLLLKFSDALLIGLDPGASVSVDGVCLTVTEIDGALVSFDVISETLVRTNLVKLSPGARVNIERSLTSNSEIGGHEVSGHVDTTAAVAGVLTSPNNVQLTLQLPPSWIDYIFSKGFIAVNGVSLTVCNVDRKQSRLDLWLIPETLRRTNLGEASEGTLLNIEIHKTTQILVDTIRTTLKDAMERALASYPRALDGCRESQKPSS